MRSPRPGRELLYLALIGLGVTAPVRLSLGAIAEPSTAECTTCCPEKDALCVVCAEDCITKANAYDRGGGSCTSES